MNMMSEIIPTNPDSQIGRLLVSVSVISRQYAYKKVIRRHLKDDVINWFMNNKVYEISQIVYGVKSEIEYIHNNRCLFCSDYTNTLYILLQMLEETYTSTEYPEFYI